MSFREPLPRLMLIGDRFTDPEIARRILEAVKSGVHWIQLRDHQASEAAFGAAAARIVDSMRAVSPDVLISINSRLGVAENLGCAVHVGTRGPELELARGLIPEALPVGRSVHRIEEVDDNRQADYLIWSPVFETRSKPDESGTGLEALSAVCRRAHPIPVIALGGIVPECTSACIQAGAYGIAVLSGLLEATDIHAAVALYAEVLKAEVK